MVNDQEVKMEDLVMVMARDLVKEMTAVIAKHLANRLVTVLDDIVEEIQSTFVTDRQILDGPFILNEIVYWCKNKKKQSMIFKVDFEKAYDSVRWNFIDDILRRFSFGENWYKWIQSCLYSSRGSVLVNESPTKEFQFHKGLKQGDSLSPFIFILVMESLHVSFQRVVDACLFNGIKLDSSLQILHLFYANDAIFMVQWCQCNIDTIIRVLDVFYLASGLRINMNKSNLMGIFVDSNKVKHAAAKIGCLVLKTSFNYLGSKVGDLTSRIQLWYDVTERMHTRCFKIWNLLWAFLNVADVNSKKSSWVRLKSVLAAKDVGGLGVSSLFALNRALMFKWVWMFFSQKNSYGLEWLKHCMARMGKLVKSFITPKMGNGANTSFWDVAWCRDIAFKNLVSRLRNPRGGVEQAQFERLKEMVEGVTLSNSNDRWSWSLVGSGDFLVSSVRKLIDNAILPKGISKTRWIKEVPIKMISDVMRKITRWRDLEYKEINSFEDWCQWISSIRLPVKQKHVFEGICYIVWWYTWNRRNLKIFGQEDPSMVNVYDEVVYRSFYRIRFRLKNGKPIKVTQGQEITISTDYSIIGGCDRSMTE
nr:RNA-directed DNA polymerase, eukaryota [Tanacetum cinerariifolium]